MGVLTKVPGVGKKTAERLMVELKSRLDTLVPEGLSAVSLSVGPADRAAGREAEDALIALGYKPNQATDAVQQALRAMASEPGEVGTEQLVTWVLRGMARGA